MDPSQLPASLQPFMSLRGLSSDDEHLDIELSTEVQHLPNYKSYIFRLSLTPILHTTVQTIQADVYHVSQPSNEESHVALLTGSLLNRPNPNFFLDADEIDAELGALASLFFNHNGRVCRIRHPSLENLTKTPGGFLWIYKVEVEPAHRGNDLALQLVTQLFKFLRDKWSLVVIQPEPLSLDGVQWPQNAPAEGHATRHPPAEVKLRRYFSRLGFVQAGRDADTACAMFLTADAFFPSPRQTLKWKTKEQVTGLDFSAPEKHHPEGLHKQLYDIILYKGSPSFYNQHPFPLPIADIAKIRKLLTSGASVHAARALHVAAKQGAGLALLQLLINHGGDVNAPDESGNRPLHEAAREISPSVPHLIQLGANRDVRNLNHETPFDILELAARIDQASVSTFEDCKPKPSTTGMSNLRNAIIALFPEQLRSQLIDGCFSPRVHKILILTALQCHSAISESANELFEDVDQLPLTDLCGNLLFLEYIPSDCLIRNKQEFHQSFLNGWEQIFATIALCLRHQKVPKVTQIRQRLEAEQDHNGICEAFFAAGGKIEYAVDAVICEACNAFRKTSDHWNFEDHQADIDALASTPLDDLYNVVRAICFQGCHDPPHGPYQSSVEVIYEEF